MAKTSRSAKGDKQARTPGVVDDASGVVKAAKLARPEKTKPSAKPVKQSKPNVFSRLSRYFSDVRAEMKRVVWPTRTEVISSSGIVITTLIIFIILIFLFDTISLELIKVLQGLGG